VTDLADLIERGDTDELLRHVDRLCDQRHWDGLVVLRDRCLAAVERGKQLWGVSAQPEYRLALEADAPFAADVVRPGAGRFALGPLPEVAAARHSWAELAPHLPAGPLAAVTAHERVVRGEDLTGDDRVDSRVLETPLALQSWEPAYPAAEYKPHEALFPTPSVPELSPVDLPESGTPVDDPDAERALLELAAVWTAESNGRAEAAAVRGSALSAVASLGVRRARVQQVEADTAMAWMAWTAASGGAHGRRRGMASGRFAAWWVLAALDGSLDDWPITPGHAEDIARSLTWVLWDAAEPDTGWALRLAVEDPEASLAWALAAADFSLE
jgi:hypothetical protein